jgi:polyphosphate kinase
VPLLERLKFVAIVAGNLDEFHMKRIGGLKQLVGARMQERAVDGRTPQEQIDQCDAVVRDLDQRLRAALARVLQELEGHGILVHGWERLAEADRARMRAYFLTNIFPLVTPQATDPAHPFPFISNLSVNLLVALRYPGDPEGSLARVKVPVGEGVPRFLKVPDREVYVPLESVLAHNLDLLFPGMEVEGSALFRVTRNANTEIDEETADDLLALIQTELRERRFAPIVRLQVARGMPAQQREMLAGEFGLDAREVFDVEGMLGMRDLWELVDLPHPALHDPPHYPVDHPEFATDREVFPMIRDAGSILVHHPYQSYATSVERFLREASRDPKVRAIKMTLYRTSEESEALTSLIDAARNGKQVAVVVELKARFDEEANIRWANRLEAYGIHVTYGVVGLKTHCKVALVVRQDYDGLRTYAHVGTGNYHAGTARLYSDLGFFTCDPGIGRDLMELFNYLTTGYKPKRNYTKLLVAPKGLKPALLEKIARETVLHTDAAPGHLQIKTNALEDAEVTRALYRAAQAGVRVDLLVRDTCRLRPGLPGLSDRARVVSVVGRFLEHSRIYYFRNGGNEEYYIGSADCMKRNLESRVEVLVPVEDPGLRKDLRLVLDAQLGDPRGAWDMGPDGSYAQRGAGGEAKHSHQVLVEWAERRAKEATRLRRRKPRGFQRRNLR